jgi:hypothetical protein
MNAGGETVLGAPAGEGGEAMARSVARLLEGAGLGVCWVVPHREREEMLMRKLVVNSIINPLTVPLVCPPPAPPLEPIFSSSRLTTQRFTTNHTLESLTPLCAARRFWMVQTATFSTLPSQK